MKRTVAITAGLLALAGVVYVAGRLPAEPPGGGAATPVAAPEPKTRIALVNMAYVFKWYGKWKGFQSQLKVDFEKYEKQAQLKNAEIAELIKVAQDPKSTAAQKDKAADDVKRLKRELEDINTSAKKNLGTTSDEQMTIIFKEVYEAAARYAQGHNYDAVFMYTEAEAQDYFNPNNIIAKLQNRACMPLYYAPGMDISQQIVMTLNASYRPGTPPAGH